MTEGGYVRFPLRYCLFASCAIVLGRSALSTAALVVADPYATGTGGGQYVANTSIIGQAPALTGYSSADPWVGDDAVSSAVDYEVRNAGLGYLDSGGRPVSASGGALNYFRTAGSAVDKRVHRSTTLTASTPGTLYVAMLMQFNSSTAATGNPFYFGIQSFSSSAAKFPIGIGFAPDGSGGLNAALFGKVSTSASPSATSISPVLVQGTASYAAGQTHLLVAKIQDSAVNDLLTLYVDPTDLTNIAGSASETLSDPGTTDGYVGSNSAWGLRTMFYGKADTGDSLFFDELRISSTSAEEAATPEPAGFGLLAAATVGLLRRRRRK